MPNTFSDNQTSIIDQLKRDHETVLENLLFKLNLSFDASEVMDFDSGSDLSMILRKPVK